MQTPLETIHFHPMVKQKIVEQLPIYLRAMKKVELELSNFATDDIGNKHKIIEICSRVKEISSIEEKVYRKSICQFDVLKDLTTLLVCDAHVSFKQTFTMF